MEIYLGNRNITLPHVVTRFPVYVLPTLIVGEELNKLKASNPILLKVYINVVYTCMYVKL